MRPLLAGIGDEAGPALADQLAAIAALGWSAIELRTVDGVHIADLDRRAFDRLADTLDERGLRTVCVDSRIGDWSSTITGDFERDLDELRMIARRAARLNTRYVRIMSYPNAGLDDLDWARRVHQRMRELAARAEQAGLVLLHENCAGWAGSDAKRALDMLVETGSPALRLLFDTGNGVAYGYSAVELLADVIEFVDHVHVKDGTDGPVWTVPGAGAAEVGRCLDLLAESGYRGALSIEPHLSLVPHADVPGAGRVDGFVAAGRALESLLAATAR
ncbi:sugar phosphate isomerase/epimerase family protein [Actinokineospora sp. HUAS TT18]|uniref:sugar phosphate isomerase/epimerase family protein n=1 Tax=Actinokineospora sp. HUAS TT18 TaxID=3447451 RepID=UPI003F527D65